MASSDFVINPNLPEKKVKKVIIGKSWSYALKQPLKAIDIEAIEAPECLNLQTPLIGHADMIMHHLGGNIIVICPELFEIVSNLKDFKEFKLVKGQNRLKKEYPFDILYNAARIGNLVFHKTAYTDPALKQMFDSSKINVLNVKQGYTKCSVLAVSEKAVITSDPSIFKKMKAEGIDVIRIKPGYINLPGYDYGFIGGAGGKISKHEIVFTGKLDNHPDKEIIFNFLEKNKVTPVFLTDLQAFDIGSVLPVIY